MFFTLGDERRMSTSVHLVVGETHIGWAGGGKDRPVEEAELVISFQLDIPRDRRRRSMREQRTGAKGLLVESGVKVGVCCRSEKYTPYATYGTPRGRWNWRMGARSGV